MAAARHPNAIQGLLRGPQTGILALPVLREGAPVWIARFMAGYSDMGVQLADACLMYLAEQESIDTIFTLDFRDFSIYRKENGQALRVIPLSVRTS
jgi:hypothetical protein